MTLKIMQGDACRFPFQIRQDEMTITPEMILDLEVTVGRLRKTYSGGGVIFDGEKWYILLTQEETLRMCGCEYIRLRIRYHDQPWEAVTGKQVAMLQVEENPGAGVL